MVRYLCQPPYSAVHFFEVSANYYSWEPSCSNIISGAIGIRSDIGKWHYLFFEGDNGYACDGCGTVYADINKEDPIGEICVDAANILDMGLQSW